MKCCNFARYALIGNCIGHSKSPIIHQEFAKQTHQALEYIILDVPIGKFEQQVRLFQQEGGKGLNITTPFKQQAFHLATHCTHRARIAKAINTIKFLKNGELLADNTDGVGFIRDITQHHGLKIYNKSILIIGAGGAARGILYPLLMQQPHQIVLANRTESTAKSLAAEFSPYGKITARSFQTISGPFDLIINTARLDEENELILPPSILSQTSFCYDVMYAEKPTTFLKWAIAHGIDSIADGIGMLVEQAAESFYLWRNVQPDTQPVIELVRRL